jgi:hypothetical protein
MPLGIREMLWMISESDETPSNPASAEDYVSHFSVMKKIAETIFSPVAYLHSARGIVLVYDVDTTDFDRERTFPKFTALIMISVHFIDIGRQ